MAISEPASAAAPAAVNVLVIAPQPFYLERGTPIAVDLLLSRLAERGCALDLVTFSGGQDRHYAGLSIHRVGSRYVRGELPPGFSVGKLYLDLLMVPVVLRLLRRKHYDVVHAVEESAFLAAFLTPFFRVPFISDVDSSMTTQLVDKFPFLGRLRRPLAFLESLPHRRAAAVVPVCEALADEVRAYRRDNVFVLHDVSLLGRQGEASTDWRVPEPLAAARESGERILMYIGNLEVYQGIDLLLESFAALTRRATAFCRLAIVGGEAERIAHYRQQAEQLGMADRVMFLGPQPVARLADLMAFADVLVSPRIQGQNTPMKLYSYLDSGRACLVTDLPTHTQVVDGRTAMIARPEVGDLSEAMAELIGNETLRHTLAENAKRLVREKHSLEAFGRKVDEIYRSLLPGYPAEPEADPGPSR